MLHGLLADLKGYLKSELEIGAPRVMQATGRRREYEAVNIKITVNNTVPDNNEWPKVVFLGVGVGIVNHRYPTVYGRVHLEIKVDRSGSQTPQSHSERPAAYARTTKEAFPETTSDEKGFGDVLFPGQSIVYEFDISSQDIPYTEFRVEGTVSRRHLLHYEHILTPPDSYTRPPLLSALRAFNEIELHNVLDSAMQSMPNLGPDTRLAELQAFTTTLSRNIPEIEATQTVLNNLYRDAPNVRIQAHIRAAHQYLSQVVAALKRMQEAASSTNSKEIDAAARDVKGLASEATQINRATEELMRSCGVSNEEVGYRYGDR